jgi:archaellum component FlaF (FlaF/FlaG flagellin family)
MPDSESKIRKILTEDIKFIIMIATVIVSITVSYMALKNDINLINASQDMLAKEIYTIQNNHLVHIQAAVDKISEKLSAHLEAK